MILDWKQNFFQGDCRYQNDENHILSRVQDHSLDDCKKNCLDTSGCSAFTYKVRLTGNECILFQGGPYTKGSKRSRKTAKCYVLKYGKISFTYVKLVELKI